MSNVLKWPPDWRDVSSYDFPGPDSWSRWAWEFLRRNPEYQKAWQDAYVDGPLKWVVELGEKSAAEHEENPDTGPSKEIFQIYDDNCRRFDGQVWNPPPKDGETEEQWRARLIKDGVERVSSVPLGVHLSRRFGYSCGSLYDPSHNSPGVEALSFETGAGPSHLGYSPPRNLDVGDIDLPWGMEPSEPRDFIVRFNLEWPIDMQLRRIKGELERTQAELKKEKLIAPKSTPVPRPDKFPSYLRVLDGEAVGASVAEMAAVIPEGLDTKHPSYNPAQTVRNYLKAGKRLRDGEYRYLCFKSWGQPLKSPRSRQR